MVNVSKRKLKQNTLKQIHNRFAKSLVKVRDSKSASAFMKELLGDEELLMLSKRLIVVYMLAEDISAYRITKTLNLSISTVLNIREKYKTGHYTYIVSEYRKKKIHRDIWKDIELLLRLGMPEMGKNRWKWLDDMYPHYK